MRARYTSESRRGVLLRGLVASLLGAACIIPDTDIKVEPERTNLSGVRIVQTIVPTREVNASCASVSDFHLACGLPPLSVPPGLIAEDGQTFCRCPAGEFDLNALRSFEIFVEDGDVDDDNNPTDRIFGAFTLDVPDPEGGTMTAVAYTNYLSPEQPAQLWPLGPGSYGDVIERPPPNLKAWTIGSEGAIDLCNDNNGSRLAAGLYSLRLVVTDRPWYVPVEVQDGKPVYENGVLVRTGDDPMAGVPDLPGGATYDVAHFVFECLDAEDDRCNCVEEVPEQ